MSILDDLLESLDEPQAHLETENWIHEAPGDLVAGRIVAIGTNTTQYGEYQILTIKPETAQAVKSSYGITAWSRQRLPGTTRTQTSHATGWPHLLSIFSRRPLLRVAGCSAKTIRGRETPERPTKCARGLLPASNHTKSQHARKNRYGRK